jgi:D-3-phosphoglycerate dehydrogenase
MPDVLAVTSPSHPIEIGTFSEALGPAVTVSELELPPGTLHVRADDELIGALEGKEAVFLRAGEITETVIASAEDLKVVAVHGSGYDHVDVEAATREGVVVLHNPEGPGPAVVEHTVGMLVTLLRGWPERFERTAAGEWSRDPVLELGQRTVGVVGLGYVGSRVARAVSETFDAEVLGYDPYVTGDLETGRWPRVTQSEMEAAGVTFVDRETLFERSDVVTLHTPLTDRTEGMVGPAELDALAGDYLVNTGRGKVVDQDALREAMAEDLLAGVALDVLETEPPEEDEPLLDHPDVYVTPHVASATDGYPPRAARAGAEKVRTALDGGRPDTVVNPAVFE